jgi:hypothetical protein
MNIELQKRVHNRIIWLTIVILFVAPYLTDVVSAKMQATSTVRGQILRNRYPVAKVSVTLYNSGRGRSSPSYTNNTGTYYIPNVPADSYILEIWITPNKPLTYNIRVGQDRYTDIQPIEIP